MMARAASVLAFVLCVGIASAAPARAFLPPPLANLNHDVRALAQRLPAATALDVLDLNTGYNAGFNAAKSMPAASTIKLPVMVEVFTQLAAGNFDLQRRVMLRPADKDYGSGVLCDAPAGSTFPISELVEKMIDISDNTATNMLIRLVGRHNINRDMEVLGLDRTHLTGDVRTAGWSIRDALRTSPADLVRLLSLMARRELVDQWSSNAMIDILEADRINTLLPAPLPQDVPIAHKTGSLNDTLNDAGIVFANDAPYVIAVMTTALPSKALGRAFIHSISRLTYSDELRLARWREANGIIQTGGVESPDAGYWSQQPPSAQTPDAGAPAGDDAVPADAPTSPPAPAPTP
ncbi:MAG: serine hydrolase [Candidatus Eremiobacteraeota bacterium]|nr:serine hydrolase [Candidatus Eremiobacteraeota bacterium]